MGTHIRRLFVYMNWCLCRVRWFVGQGLSHGNATKSSVASHRLVASTLIQRSHEVWILLGYTGQPHIVGNSCKRVCRSLGCGRHERKKEQARTLLLFIRRCSSRSSLPLSFTFFNSFFRIYLSLPSYSSAAVSGRTSFLHPGGISPVSWYLSRDHWR